MSIVKPNKKIIRNVGGFSIIKKSRFPSLSSFYPFSRKLKFYAKDPEAMKIEIRADQKRGFFKKIGKKISRIWYKCRGDARIDYAIDKKARCARMDLLDRTENPIHKANAMIFFLQKMKQKGVNSVETTFGMDDIKFLSRFGFKLTPKIRGLADYNTARVDLNKMSLENIPSLAHSKPNEKEVEKMQKSLKSLIPSTPPPNVPF